MTVETIVEAEYILKDYWTKMRFPYQTKGKGWSDVDILAYNPEKKHLVISESKVRGPKKNVSAYTEDTKKAYGTILEFDGDNYFSFIKNLPKICSDKTVFNDFDKMVKKLTIQLVSNIIIEDELKASAAECVLKKVKAELKNSNPSLPANMEIEVKIDTTMDVIARVIEEEKKHPQGRRYGHAMLDIAREINRYSNPTVNYAGRGKSKTGPIKKQAVKQFAEAVGMVRL